MFAAAQEKRQAGTSTATRIGRVRQKRMQAAGLERLITVLEHAASQAAGEDVAVPRLIPERPNRTARLLAAHAAYALASSPMERTGVNGWLCRRTFRNADRDGS